MATCKFGTDGIRGTVGVEPMVPDTILRLGYAIGAVLGGPDREVIVGKDTRLSGYMVESAIEAGLAAAGVNTALTGPIPTSAIARLVAEEGAAAGIVISASHNPFQDNGIKIFDATGSKLSDDMESEIERLVAKDAELSWSREPGKARRIDDATERYVQFCLSTVEGLSLAGKRIVVDAANGASYASAPEVFRTLGAEVREFGCQPDGRNINLECGALQPGKAAQLVTSGGFDLGVVLDGDGDRLALIGSDGRVLDGDACLYMACACMKKKGAGLEGVVGTTMSNQALEDAVQDAGAQFVRAAVGDRNVASELHKRGWTVGGEPSGHLLFLDRHVTGDGVIAALALLELLAAAGSDLDEVAAGYRPMPSYSAVLATSNPGRLQSKLADLVAEVHNGLGKGRVVLRKSGTESVLRLLVEASDQVEAEAAGEKIRAAAAELQI